MSVLIQINGEDAREAIRELSTLASGISGQVVTAEAPKSQDKPARSASKPSKPVKEKPAEDPVVDESEEDAGDEPIPTDVDLRALASEVGKKGTEAKAAIKKLLDKYGSANVTGVPENKRVAFKRDLEALAAEEAE